MATATKGEASPAAAGLLVPSLETNDGPSHRFAVAARDFYPAYVAELAALTYQNVALDRSGVLQVALDGADEARLRDSRSTTAEWVDAQTLRSIEPSLGHARGALLHANDGWVDNVLLLRALTHRVDSLPAVRRVDTRVISVSRRRERAEVRSSTGEMFSADILVLAAGAWVNQIAGLPRALPVSPVRGQMISYEAAPLRHAVYGPYGYLVPRADGRTLVGATMEYVGFDASVTDDALASLRDAATRTCPALAGARELAAWAGLRPVTPDFEPIIGRDPEWSTLLYACGHSRNGVLMAPLTAHCIASLAFGESPEFDVTPFRVERF